ncbi:DNA polymerase III subunit delta [candidate division WOR-1 bacterium RIFOXYC2_FULL_37_10]|uniref:DNA polymerase III subunit delta n=1 Tax=candidate division WOR-1 bacterium RIFOXYB2_FULL_37_13 TaxID=1802579 RepID=A0A1F4SVI2_UNCSA|nr:MAG: DNA polymerase III subunit delta [candidate division WOR-1 bacterium RIFOXYA2_FULL_37_7]OGC24430.1 MAG: DNA polymerase III subunit delta [candidate division WOR-1 bacterium RIFOXYB2_FULL_37_13]OGC37438.1 MAG: DNA polymerase III subunit delta [candidate division WOR-1 bacterium RIFOXYC2_FULL_37_10]
MIYLLYGEEQFLVKEEYLRILAKHPNYSKEILQDVSASQIVEMVSMPSLFYPQRIIVLDEFDFEKSSDLLVDCLSNIPEGVIVIIKNPLEMDKRSKLYKMINSKGEVHEFKTIPEWEEDKAVSFVKKMFLRFGKKISDEDARFLVEGVGRNLSLLYSEIEKIATYLGGYELVARNDIEALMTRSGWDLFTFLNAVFAKDSSLSFVTLDRLFKDNEEPISLLSFLSSQYRTLFKTKLLASMGHELSQIASLLKASPYYIKRLYNYSKRFEIEELKNGLQRMYDADLKIKSGYSGRVELSLLLASLW